MKNFWVAIVALLTLTLGFAGCDRYNDDDLWRELNEIKENIPEFSFDHSSNAGKVVIFNLNEIKKVKLNIKNLTDIQVLDKPENWKVDIAADDSLVAIQAPSIKGKTFDKGTILLTAIDKKGNTLLASLKVCASLDFTDPDGTFVVTEGNMTSVNGSLVYYDKNGKEYKDVFENANDGLEIGNVVQDMFIANERIYLLTQNGDRMGGAGRFVVCDARTLKLIYADPLNIKTPDGKDTWPQHMVIVNNNTAYIQYSEVGFEATSGICKLTLSDKAVKVEQTVDGSFGAFTTTGATKTRMVYSRGKVYAGCGESVIIINPANDSKIEKRVTFKGRQVKGIAKGADNNLYIVASGTFTGNANMGATFTSNPIVVGLNHTGDIVHEQELSGIQLPVATWSPAVGLCASFTDPYLYFVDTDAFNATSSSRYNYQTKKLDKNYVSGSETIYGIMGEHPTTKKLWVAKSTYVSSTIHVFDVTGASAKEEKRYSYPTQKGASPAGVDFAYRFTSKFIEK